MPEGGCPEEVARRYSTQRRFVLRRICNALLEVAQCSGTGYAKNEQTDFARRMLPGEISWRFAGGLLEVVWMFTSWRFAGGCQEVAQRRLCNGLLEAALRLT